MPSKTRNCDLPPDTMIRVLLALVAMFTLAGSVRAAESDKPKAEDITTEQALEKAGKLGLLNAEPTPQDRLTFRAMEAAFDCAILAAYAPKDSEEAKEFRRLFEFGASNGRQVLPRVRAELGKGHANVDPIMALWLEQSDDFWLGWIAAQRGERIENLIRKETTSGQERGPWDSYQALAEFRQRNCALIGPR